MTASKQLYQQQVRIFYPLQQGKITLRTEQDWKIDIEPVSVDDNGQSLTFNVESALPFLYCKPCLLTDGEVRWAAGENYLVIMTQPGISEIHPFFWAPETGSFPPLIEFDSAIMGSKHRLRVYLPPATPKTPSIATRCCTCRTAKTSSSPTKPSPAPNGTWTRFLR